MAKHRFSFSERLAIWEAYGRVCIYCEEPIPFRELEIDHILPESLLEHPGKLQALTEEYDLDNDFSINGFTNWVAAHHKCNRRKSSTILSKNRALHFLQIAERKGKAAENIWKRYEKANNANKVLAQLRVLMENGVITRQEIVDFAMAVVRNVDIGLNNPVIVCFGLNFFELHESQLLPDDAPDSYSELCDWLEEYLVEELNRKLQCRIEIVESADNRETFSIRFALWDVDLNKLDTIDFKWWEILEVALHTQIYDEFVQRI